MLTDGSQGDERLKSPMHVNTRRLPAGFTLVELLVVMAIIATLVGLMLPAVQSAREAGRATECRNRLRQLALGLTQHADVRKHYPSAGWSWLWTGDPDRGSGESQPGSWCFSILPFMEETALHQLGADGQPDVLTATQRQGTRKAAETPVPSFYCPTRRAAIAQPIAVYDAFRLTPVNSDPYKQGARTDFAMNAGSSRDQWYDFPSTWGDGIAGRRFANMSGMNGLAHQRSRVRPSEITDGLTHTYLVGEKHVDLPSMASGGDAGDDQSFLYGDELDTTRRTYLPPTRTSNPSNFRQFGSAHPVVFGMAMADGSVHSISYDVDPSLHSLLGSRNDGKHAALPSQ